MVETVRQIGDAAEGGKAKRLQRLEAAMTKDEMAPTVRYLTGRLARLGLDLKDVDLHSLNEKLTAAAISPTDRIAIKNAAYACGLID